MVAGQLHWSCYSESESPTRPDALVSSVMLEASEIVAGQVDGGSGLLWSSSGPVTPVTGARCCEKSVA